METAIQFISAFLMMFILMSGVWLIQRRLNDGGVVDVAWSYGIGIVAVYFALVTGGFAGRKLLVGAMAAAWSFRLGTYLFLNRVKGRAHEDGRYRTLREKWGPHAQRNMFLFFQFQGVTDVVLALSPLVAMLSPRPVPGALDYAGAAIWLVAVAGESAADLQLARFRGDPANKGRTCRAGLWRYSRHPNYFFEWLHWWSYVPIALGHPAWWLTLIAPALMLYFLLRMTGIPATEAQAVLSRGDDYRDYQHTTSAFVPWFPRSGPKSKV